MSSADADPPADAPELYDTINATPEPTGAGDGTDVDVDACIEAIERPRQVDRDDGVPLPNDDSYWLPGLDLPGFGAAYDDCGDDFPVFCEGCGAITDEDGHVITVGRTCDRAQCPRCAPNWARKRATEVCGKLGATRAVFDHRRDAHQRVHHVVFSPPWDWCLEAADPLERTVDVLRELLGEFDMEGVVFYHPWSGKDGDDRGAWKQRLFSDRDWERVKDDLVLRPHFHALLVGHRVPGGDAVARISDATGWTIHRITQADSDVSIYDEADLARAATYCLSHTGLRETDEGTSAQYRYIGQTINHEVEVFESNRERIDAEVRAASPLTLGLEPAHLRCEQQSVDVSVSHHSTVDVAAASARAAASRDGGSSTALKGGPAEGSSATTPDGAAAPGTGTPSPGGTATETTVEREDCHGQLVPITKAPRYLTDPDWRDAAAFADALADTFYAWFRGEWSADQ